ncbi:hypothetical protein BC835DRAFT_404280 [Cytidiella melzeri]|nr:hypothetical protein BC835DRAFT_404280 [Cytidiella melzeri]
MRLSTSLAVIFAVVTSASFIVTVSAIPHNLNSIRSHYSISSNSPWPQSKLESRMTTQKKPYDPTEKNIPTITREGMEAARILFEDLSLAFSRDQAQELWKQVKQGGRQTDPRYLNMVKIYELAKALHKKDSNDPFLHYLQGYGLNLP